VTGTYLLLELPMPRSASASRATTTSRRHGWQPTMIRQLAHEIGRWVGCAARAAAARLPDPALREYTCHHQQADRLRAGGFDGHLSGPPRRTC
jgi:hypothetical protein